MVLIEEAESSVHDLELNKMSVDTALQNVENIIKDRDRLQEWATWLQGALHESKKKIRFLIEEKDKLKADLSTTECDVAKFSKRITQLEKVNAQRDGLLDKIGQLEEVTKTLKSENLSLKVNTEEAVKVGVEDFRSQFEFTSNYENLQAFFINYGAQQVLTEVKELHPNLDFSTIEADYPTPKEVKDGVGQPPADRAEGPADQPPADDA
ncbi:hypothetical protein Fot_06961 [Forsythia ovata]|uniref:Uncharacterized protein n=1 Tax=Forsythia ovata TaxID=205694 RepID=A0ABD1WUG8_9LAMI